MGVFKNDVGRPSNKTIKTRNILKGIMLIVIVILAFGIGYYFNNKREDNNKRNFDSEKNYKEITLSDSKKIEINNRLNDHGETPFSFNFSWAITDTEYNFSNDKYKLLFLQSVDYEYGDIITDLSTNKMYYKLSSVQEKSEKYFNKKIGLNGNEEYYDKSGDIDSEKYKDYMYINHEVSNDAHMICPNFKIKNVLYDKEDNIYILNIDILDGDVDYLNLLEDSNNEESLRNYLYASGIIKFEKIDNKYYLKSFKFKK